MERPKAKPGLTFQSMYFTAMWSYLHFSHINDNLYWNCNSNTTKAQDLSYRPTGIHFYWRIGSTEFLIGSTRYKKSFVDELEELKRQKVKKEIKNYREEL